MRILLVLALLLALGCGKDEEGGGPFSFTVTVVDSEEKPLAGVQVGCTGHYDGCSTITEIPGLGGGLFPVREEAWIHPAYPAPFASGCAVPIYVPVQSLVRVEVRDLADRTVRKLEDGEWEWGVHFLPWDGRDDEGNVVLDGVYSISATVRDARSGVYLLRQTVRATFHGSIDPERSLLGETDEEGRYETTDILLFPGVLWMADQTCRDVEGDSMGVGNFSDLFILRLRRWLPDDSGQLLLYEQTEEIQLGRDENDLQLVWDDQRAELVP